MLSAFPMLFSYQLVVPLFFRLIVGLIFLWFGVSKLTSERSSKTAMFENAGMRPGSSYLWLVAILEIIAGSLLVIGLYTQIAALVLSIMTLGALIIKRRQEQSIESSYGFLFLLLVIAFSLLFLGPGFLSFDRPL